MSPKGMFCTWGESKTDLEVSTMKEVYVVNCCRTAVGSFGGSLKDTPAPELGAIVVKEALNRAGVKPEQVDELMFGCILTAACPTPSPPTPWAWCAAPA